jgi:AcrR family transcriptional regulator/DNA-binding MarR family transcriptional regulator
MAGIEVAFSQSPPHRGIKDTAMAGVDESGSRRVRSGGRSRAVAVNARSLTRERQGAHVSEMQRRRLLLATVELVAQEGLDGTSVGGICQRAHVSRRTFYDLFADREECVVATLRGEVDRIGEHVTSAYGTGRSWRERVRAGLAALLEHFEREPAAARLCVIEATRGPRVLEYRRGVLDTLARVADEGRHEASRRGGPPQLTAESLVGGALAVIAARLSEPNGHPTDLLNPLMGMIVYPYLGPAAAHKELERPTVSAATPTPPGATGETQGSRLDPFANLSIRITFRTARVLATIAERPGASNREIGEAAGVHDQGQISRLLTRLARNELIANTGHGQARGEANAWTLTERGSAIHNAIATHEPRQ